MYLKSLEVRKTKWIARVFNNMLSWMTHQIILHDFTSGGCKMALHNTVPQGTMVPWGTAWCIKYENSKQSWAHCTLCCRKEHVMHSKSRDWIRTQLSYIIGYEIEGHYHHSAMLCWEPEGRYHHWLCTAIEPFWFSTEHHSTMLCWEPEGRYCHWLCIAIVPFWLSTENCWIVIRDALLALNWWKQGNYVLWIFQLLQGVVYRVSQKSGTVDFHYFDSKIFWYYQIKHCLLKKMIPRSFDLVR